jgi:hypothetical protein
VRSRLLVVLFGVLPSIWGCGPRVASQSGEYQQAIAKLAHSESPDRDEELCKALATVLDDLAARGDPSVYVVFADLSDPADAPEAERDLREWKEDFEFRGQEPPILSQDIIFGQDAAGRRQKELVEELRGALRTVADDCVLKLVPLEPGTTRNGKIILDIRTIYHRGNTFLKVHFGKTPYLLREFSVDWEAKLINREGNALIAVKSSANSGRRATQEVGGGWPHEDSRGGLQHLGEIASWPQLLSAYADLRSLLEKKLGTSAAQQVPN